MDQSTLSKKERGERALNIDELLRFAAVLDVSPLELLLPRTTDDELQLSGSVTVPAAQAREWIRGWRQLEYFHGVSKTAVVLRDQRDRERIERLETEIELIDIEIRVRQELIREAEVQVKDLWAQGTIFDTPESNLAGGPFEKWIEVAQSRIEELKAERAELNEKSREVEPEAQGLGWMHRDTPAHRSL